MIERDYVVGESCVFFGCIQQLVLHVGDGLFVLENVGVQSINLQLQRLILTKDVSLNFWLEIAPVRHWDRLKGLRKCLRRLRVTKRRSHLEVG